MDINEIKALLEKNNISASGLKLNSVSADIPMKFFNGCCLRKNGDDKIYLVMNAKKCYIPTASTFFNLFNDDHHVLHADGTAGQMLDFIIDEMETGESITEGSLLIRPISDAPVYLLTNNKKYWITSQEQFDACHFSWDKVKEYPHIIIDAIPSGNNDAFDNTAKKK